MMSGSREELAGARAVAVPALDRGMALLRVLGASSEPLTLAELSDAIGVSRSTVYSLLATLQRHGMVEKEPRHKTYRLGVAAFELGSAYLSGVSLLPIFNEVAQRLVNLCHETVKLAVLDGRDVVYLGKQEGLYTVRIVARVGSRMPAHATAVGKVLLAELSDTALAELYQGYSFPTRTPHTIASFRALAEQIAAVRAQGSAEDREESSIGLQCVAAPVRDHSRAVVAAVSIGVPNDRLNEQRLAELRQLLIEHAQDISRRLGWSE
jgi:IclR family transcriptional regulator, KDG regulon repressor